MLGGFAAALVFVITLVFLALVFFFVFTHAAHAYLAAVQDTAGGIDDVRLPRDPLGDRLDSAAHLGWLLVLWLAPAALLSRALRHDWLPDAGALRFLLLAAPGLWLFFPVALLSSLSATSRWVPFRPAVLWQMARTFPSVLGFYLITG